MTTILPLPEHVYTAAAKAATGRFDPNWEYYQGRWRNKCGTACCLYGGACLEAGLPVPNEGPPAEWCGQSVEHALLAGAMYRTNAGEALASVERIRVGKVTDVDRGRAVRQAAKGGHTEIVRVLLASGAISDKYRGWAVLVAAKGGHAEIVRMLLASGPITDDHRGAAVRVAAKGGHAAIVRILLESGKITDADRDRAVWQAAKGGHAEIVAMLAAK